MNIKVKNLLFNIKDVKSHNIIANIVDNKAKFSLDLKSIDLVNLPPQFSYSTEGEDIYLVYTSHRKVIKNYEDKKIRSLIGTYQSHVKNAITGLTKGFSIGITLKGISYRVEKKDNILIFRVGYTHTVDVSIPQGVNVNVDTISTLTLSGVDKQKVFGFCRDIRKLKKVNVYNSTGIIPTGYIIRTKEKKK